jgi:hypothetical protein
MGMLQTAINWDLVVSLKEAKHSCGFIAKYLGISRDTLLRRCLIDNGFPYRNL